MKQFQNINKISLLIVGLISTQLVNAQNIQIDTLIDTKAINCYALFQHPESKIAVLLQDFSRDGQKNVKLNKSKQTMIIDNNTYYGVQGYRYYKTAHTEQDDLAVDHHVFGSQLIKIALQKYKSGKTQSNGYYFVFKGTPTTVLYHLRKVVGDDWNIENALDETPQGNSKLSCGYTR